MNTITLLSVALILGYALTVGSIFAFTMGITAVAPRIVQRDTYLTNLYKLLQDLLWLLCPGVGAYAAGLLAGGVMPWTFQTGLATVLIAMMWRNNSEIQQRGIGHAILSSVFIVVGVFEGYRLALR
jgi:hypothetical protein